MQNSTDGANSPTEGRSTPTSLGRRALGRARRIPTPVAALGAAAAVTVAGMTTAFAAENPAPAPAPAPAVAPAAAAPMAGPAPEQAPAPAPQQSDSPAVRDRIVKTAEGELGTKETGDNCNKYSHQCASWCGLFATWAWEQAGVNVDHEQFAFTGNIYKAGQEKGTAFDKEHLDQAKPGDALIYGSGPESSKTSKHVGIVEHRDGNTVTMVEGNAGPGSTEVHRSVHQLDSGEYYGGVHPWEMRS